LPSAGRGDGLGAESESDPYTIGPYFIRSRAGCHHPAACQARRNRHLDADARSVFPDKHRKRLSFEPIYWFTRGIPTLRGGAGDTNTDPGNLDFTGKMKRSPAARISIPVSKNATIRVSYFKTNSYTGTTTAPANLNLFGQAVTGGDFLTTSSDLEGFKLSYDYLSYFWKGRNSELRLKTLYELQRISVNNEVDDFVVDTTGALINIKFPSSVRNRSSPDVRTGAGAHSVTAIFAGKCEDRVSGCRTAATSSMPKRKSGSGLATSKR